MLKNNTYTGWSDIQTVKIKTYNNLETGTYKIKVRAINKTYTNEGKRPDYNSLVRKIYLQK